MFVYPTFVYATFVYATFVYATEPRSGFRRFWIPGNVCSVVFVLRLVLSLCLCRVVLMSVSCCPYERRNLQRYNHG